MEASSKRLSICFMLVCSLFIFSHSVIAEPETYSNLVDVNETPIDILRYDRMGQVYDGHDFGSNSYTDIFFTNGNLYAKVCHKDFDVGSKVDYRYYTESLNTTRSIMNFVPLSLNATDNPDNDGKCDFIDIEISATRAIYPGYVMPFITNGNDEVALTDYKELLNGSYEIGVMVDSPPKVYYFFVKGIKDDNNMTIGTVDDSMLMSFLDKDDVSLVEQRVAPNEYLAYTGDMTGLEEVYVNGLSSLEIITVDECKNINKTGYYLLNTSLNQVNETCLVVENASDVVFNFGDDIIDGDYEENGSLSPDTCSIVVRDSNRITLENLRSQNFLHGLCIENSNVSVFGDYTSYHINGVFINDSSNVRFEEVTFGGNEGQDLIVEHDSHVVLDNVSFASANITSEFFNANVKGVEVFPNYSNFPENMNNIGQLIQFTNTSKNAWAEIKFIYYEPLPNSVVTDNISVFKYNGTYESWTENVFDPITNTTRSENKTDWVNGIWRKLFTIVSPSESLIQAENVSTFSVFAPFGFVVDPEPEPNPTPNPTTGGGGGGGNSKTRGTSDESAFDPEAITFDLELPSVVRVRQGEFIDVPFNLSYTGGIPAYNVTVRIEGEKGWETSEYNKEVFMVGENATDSLVLQPYIKTIPEKKLIPVSITVEMEGGEQLVLQKLLYVDVLPRGDLSLIKVLEYPPVIKINPENSLDVSFLVENVGDLPIDNIIIKFDPSPCLKNISGINNITYDEVKNFEYTFTAAEPNTCDYNIKFYSADKLVGFVPVKFIIKKIGWIDLAKDTQISILLFLLILWTALTMIVFSKERDRIVSNGESKKKDKNNLDN